MSYIDLDKLKYAISITANDIKKANFAVLWQYLPGNYPAAFKWSLSVSTDSPVDALEVFERLSGIEQEAMLVDTRTGEILKHKQLTCRKNRPCYYCRKKD